MLLRGKDVAKILGVSESTISIVVNNRPGVSDARRKEIIRKMKEMGCAYLLRENTAEKDSIGFVVYKRKGNIIDESPFFSYFLEGISDRLRSLNCKLNLIYMNTGMSKPEQTEVLRDSKCSAFIIFAVEMIYEDMQVFKDSGYPFVMLDNSFVVNDVDTVSINNFSGIKKAVNYLVQMGHKRIGYIQSRVSINSFVDRFTAYKNALAMYGLSFDGSLVAPVGYSDAKARQDMCEYILSHKNRLPDAFLSDNDLVACGALKGIEDAGLKVPDDISLIGFDDRPIAGLISPALTTMMVPKDIFGNKCVDLLIDRMQTKRQYSLKVEVGTILIERESVKKLN